MSQISLSYAWKYKKAPRFNTTVQKTAAEQGSVYIANQVYPVWDFVFEIPLLQGRLDDPTSTLSALLGLFIASKGRAGTFVFSDPRDNAVTNYQFGTGDGTSQAFQLTRPIGTNLGVDIVQSLNGTPTIKINGTPTVLYTMTNGLITFNTAPASGAALTWTGNFYFLLRFTQDTLADLEMMFDPSATYASGKWQISQLEFESVIL